MHCSISDTGTVSVIGALASALPLVKGSMPSGLHAPSDDVVKADTQSLRKLADTMSVINLLILLQGLTMQFHQSPPECLQEVWGMLGSLLGTAISSLQSMAMQFGLYFQIAHVPAHRNT